MDSGWQPLPGRLLYQNEVLYGVSQDGKSIVGNSYYAGDVRSHAWRWTESSGQVELQFDDAIPAGTPGSISNDGQRTVGVTIRPTGVPPPLIAVHWSGSNPPARVLAPDQQELSIARVCNQDCSLVFGSGWPTYDPTRPESGDAWFWSPDGRFSYLGQPAGTVAPSVAVTDVSSDGSFVIGTYATSRFVGSPPFELEVDSWLWMQSTGMLSLRSVLEQDLAVPGPWESREAVSIASDGKTILLGGFGRPTSTQPAQYRAGLLRLIPKSASSGVDSTR